ncbi:unnamed protein product [Amoebophrya sp. A25]|nr:unnamed protein product [Amoebophrya sp. A25]|eukprot:GSA25T00000855001.1
MQAITSLQLRTIALRRKMITLSLLLFSPRCWGCLSNARLVCLPWLHRFRFFTVTLVTITILWPDVAFASGSRKSATTSSSRSTTGHAVVALVRWISPQEYCLTQKSSKIKTRTGTCPLKVSEKLGSSTGVSSFVSPISFPTLCPVTPPSSSGGDLNRGSTHDRDNHGGERSGSRSTSHHPRCEPSDVCAPGEFTASVSPGYFYPGLTWSSSDPRAHRGNAQETCVARPCSEIRFSSPRARTAEEHARRVRLCRNAERMRALEDNTSRKKDLEDGPHLETCVYVEEKSGTSTFTSQKGARCRVVGRHIRGYSKNRDHRWKGERHQQTRPTTSPEEEAASSPDETESSITSASPSTTSFVQMRSSEEHGDHYHHDVVHHDQPAAQRTPSTTLFSEVWNKHFSVEGLARKERVAAGAALKYDAAAEAFRSALSRLGAVARTYQAAVMRLLDHLSLLSNAELPHLKEQIRNAYSGDDNLSFATLQERVRELRRLQHRAARQNDEAESIEKEKDIKPQTEAIAKSVQKIVEAGSEDKKDDNDKKEPQPVVAKDKEQDQEGDLEKKPVAKKREEEGQQHSKVEHHHTHSHVHHHYHGTKPKEKRRRSNQGKTKDDEDEDEPSADEEEENDSQEPEQRPSSRKRTPSRAKHHHRPHKRQHHRHRSPDDDEEDDDSYTDTPRQKSRSPIRSSRGVAYTDDTPAVLPEQILPFREGLDASS